MPATEGHCCRDEEVCEGSSLRRVDRAEMVFPLRMASFVRRWSAPQSGSKFGQNGVAICVKRTAGDQQRVLGIHIFSVPKFENKRES